MAYEATEWACGDIVTAEKLNKLERGVQEIMSDYVPTNWQCGDTITAEKLNKLEQAVADFECGSSDFSTAQVTINNTTSAPISVPLSKIEEEELFATTDVLPESTTTVEAVLYKGFVGITFVGHTVTGSGSVETTGSGAIIAGDCSLTVADDPLADDLLI